MASKAFDKAKKNKADEFYTQLHDIEKEVRHYKTQLKDKVVFCNCDDPYESNFFKYFAMNFNYLGLKKLIATSYRGSPVIFTQLSLIDGNEMKYIIGSNNKAYKLIINEVRDHNHDGAIDLSDVEWLISNKKNVLTELKGDGDFRSLESIELLKEADVVITNPPFSLFKEYVEQLFFYKKQFLIIGNVNAVTYKDIFKLIKLNRIWLGESIHSGDREFRVPDNYSLDAAGCRIDKNGNKFIRVKGVRWFTNLDVPIRHEKLTLYKKYSLYEYPKYENYNAINVDRTVDIPVDYEGEIGVPITFIDKYNPDQFEIIALGITGSINFSKETKMEILKKGRPTGKYTTNAKGTLYKLYNPKVDKKLPAFKDVITGDLYSSIYARIVIKRKINGN